MPDLAYWLERLAFAAALVGFPVLAVAAWLVFLVRRIEGEEELRLRRETAKRERQEQEKRRQDQARFSDPLFRYRQRAG